MLHLLAKASRLVSAVALLINNLVRDLPYVPIGLPKFLMYLLMFLINKHSSSQQTWNNWANGGPMLAFRHCRCWTDYVQLGLPVLACIRPLSVCTPVNVGPILDLCWAECQINVGPIMPCRNRTLIVWQQSAQFQLVTTSYINPRFSSPRTRCVLLGECYQAAGRQSCSAAHRLCRLKQC